MSNMSGIVAWLGQEFQGASSIISLMPNSAHLGCTILGTQGNLGTCDHWKKNSKRWRKWPKKQKRLTKIRRWLEKGQQNLLSCKKRSTNFSKQVKKGHNKFGTIYCEASSSHQHGRASGIVDGNFTYWKVCKISGRPVRKVWILPYWTANEGLR